MEKTVEIYIALLGEGTPTMRGTQAVDMGDGMYKVLPTPFYDLEDEIWEFPPESIVRAIPTQDVEGNEILLAVR